MNKMKKVLALFIALSMLTACTNQAANIDSSEQSLPQSTVQQTTQEINPTSEKEEVKSNETVSVKEEVKPEYQLSNWITSSSKPLSTAENRKKDKGVVQVFGQSEETLKENQKLAENLEFTTRQMENLDRGLVAVNNGNGNFVSWRWLGNESNTVKYNLYRNGEKIGFTIRE